MQCCCRMLDAFTFMTTVSYHLIELLLHYCLQELGVLFKILITDNFAVSCAGKKDNIKSALLPHLVHQSMKITDHYKAKFRLLDKWYL